MTFRLTPGTAADYLRGRGVISADQHVTAEPLGGGVSNDVVAVTGPGVDLVVKQALPRLRVEQEWLASPRRVLTEAAALALAARLRPQDVPAVIDVDDKAMTLTIARANRSLRNWKSDLLAGRIEPATALRLAVALAQWHTATAADQGLREKFGVAAFEQLRIAPFYRAVMACHPGLAGKIGELAEQLLATRLCLVHGDFSPKNVLADSTGLAVLDWEVAHYGDPVFDLAFLQAHLLLKAVHAPVGAARYRALAAAFLDAYGERAGPGLRRPGDYLSAHVGCLLLARVDGKSPAEYLTGPERDRVRSVALRALSARAGTVSMIWEDVDG